MPKKRQIGVRLRAYRMERGLTQEQLAEKINRSVEAISNLERGISVPSEATLHRLARCLDVSVDDLLLERVARAKDESLELYRAIELLKMLDEGKLKLAYSILKAIAEN